MLETRYENVIRGIRAWGYRERAFCLTSEGQWTAKDAEWNYFDVPHLNEVHSQADAEVLFYGDRCTSSVLRQRVGPLRFASLLTIYSDEDTALCYASTVGPFILVVRSAWGNIGKTAAKVETSYHVFAPRFLGWSLGIVQRLLTRNYNILMSEDLPLRERKGQLRQRGFSFVHDSVPHSFLASRNTGASNVVSGPDLYGTYEYRVSLLKVRDEGSIFLGPDDLRGLRVEWLGNSVLVAPRMCPHEGACLDSVGFEGKSLRCPWHGRRVRVYCEVDVSKGQVSSSSDVLVARVDNGDLLMWYTLRHDDYA